MPAIQLRLLFSRILPRTNENTYLIRYIQFHFHCQPINIAILFPFITEKYLFLQEKYPFSAGKNINIKIKIQDTSNAKLYYVFVRTILIKFDLCSTREMSKRKKDVSNKKEVC